MGVPSPLEWSVWCSRHRAATATHRTAPCGAATARLAIGGPRPAERDGELVEAVWPDRLPAGPGTCTRAR